MSCCSVDHRFCVDCKDFLPKEMFKSGIRRNWCRMHFNERQCKILLLHSSERPQRTQAKKVWQNAYIDSIKLFNKKMNITPSAVQRLLQHFKISPTESVRLVPANPFLQLSIQNFCLTSVVNRKDMCFVWKRLQDKEQYQKFLDPQAMRKIYARSHDDLRVQT